MKTYFRALLRVHYQFIGVLLGAFLVAVSTGTYTNWDAQLEFEATTNVVNQGYPIVTSGLMINQPPLGFYLDAPVFYTFGLSYLNGVAVVTAFGLGCIVLVYALGTLLYGKTTGLLAAALFGIVPWHLYLSRIFLIDNQALFFSLLSLIFGVLAVRRNSNKLIPASGVAFAAALLTKLFAVFMLIPLALIIYFSRKKGAFKLTLKKTLLFLAPTALMQAIWYGGIANQNFFGVYLSSDFTHPELVTDPSPLFLPITLVKSAGWFLLLAGLFSLAMPLAFRKIFAGRLWLDAVCTVTIAVVAGLNLLLVFGFHLTVPYISVVKYNYFALPFFCLLAASLADKSTRLIAATKLRSNIGLVKAILVVSALALLLAAIVENITFLNQWWGFVSFGVDSVMYYPFDVYSAPEPYFDVAHSTAFVLIVGSLALPLVIKCLKKPFSWLSSAVSS